MVIEILPIQMINENQGTVNQKGMRAFQLKHVEFINRRAKSPQEKIIVFLFLVFEISTKNRKLVN